MGFKGDVTVQEDMWYSLGRRDLRSGDRSGGRSGDGSGDGSGDWDLVVVENRWARKWKLGPRIVTIYLDDILIMATTLVELVKLTHGILQRLLDLNLYLQPEKCSFNQTSVEYLGLIISKGELHMNPVKLMAVSNWSTPKTMKEVQK